jgi:hypothetical protein
MKTGTMRETAVGHRETLQAIYPAALVVERQQPCNYQLRSRNGDNRTRHQNPRHDDDDAQENRTDGEGGLFI